MADAIIAARRPAVLDLEPGTYHWCACGRSKNQPFCDGSHTGSGIMPKVLKIDLPTKVALCQCKQTGNAPYCDGRHRSLAEP